MQSVCALLPDELAEKVVAARQVLAAEPSIGAIYDPPFSHITLQLAEEYDWDGLADALRTFAAGEQPFEARTTGLGIFSDGKSSGVLVTPYLDERLRDFQARLWEKILPFAQGNVRKMDTPGTFLPHITIKRCSGDHDATGRALAKLLAVGDFGWNYMVDNVAVQHDPGKNSRTHYLRLRYALGGSPADPAPEGQTNATITALREEKDAAGATLTVASVDLDAGGGMEHTWTAPELVALMALLRCSDIHFSGGRCQIEGGKIVNLEPKTPNPVV